MPNAVGINERNLTGKVNSLIKRMVIIILIKLLLSSFVVSLTSSFSNSIVHGVNVIMNFETYCCSGIEIRKHFHLSSRGTRDL